MNNLRKQKGFTLIELLVVIAIIGLLSTLSIVALNNARARARDARRVADIKQIQTALELYFNDAGVYPASVTSGSGIIYSGAVYMNSVPTAPTPVDTGCSTTTNAYTYVPRSSNASYTLSYCLGANTADILAGVHTATPAGIK